MAMPDTRRESVPFFRRLLASEYFVFGLCIGYFLLLWPLVPELGTIENLGNIVAGMLPLLAASIGQTFVLITAGIDLSMTAVIAACSVAGASVMTADGGLLAGSPLAAPAAILAMLTLGSLLGLANGLAISRLHMPPFMVTLATMMFVSGFAIWVTGSRNIQNLPRAFTAISQGAIFTIPWAVLLVTALAVVAHWTLARSLIGSWLYAVGHNADAAAVSGVPVGQVTSAAYLISGICAATTSILLTSRLETGSPVMGERMILDIVAASVIGGNSLFGGKGKVPWAIFGALFVTLVDNSLYLLGLSYFTILAAKGGIILAAAGIDASRRRWEG